jgi:hypothetical protein
VGVGDVVVGAEGRHVEGDLAQGVRAVDEDRDAAAAAEGRDARDGEEDGGAGGDVVDGCDRDGRVGVERGGYCLRRRRRRRRRRLWTVSECTEQ